MSGGACIPLFDFPDDAVRVLGLLADHGAWRDQDPGVLPAGPTDVTVEALRALVDGVLADDPDGRWLTWGEVTDLAAAAGLACWPQGSRLPTPTLPPLPGSVLGSRSYSRPSAWRHIFVPSAAGWPWGCDRPTRWRRPTAACLTWWGSP